jgi:8-oxo-dGTP pyrophosphatase MutT (NUDIX family)
MSKIRDAVAGVLVCKDQVFVIKRQKNLKAFPGYWSFPGGKVDLEDSKYQPMSPLFKITQNHLMGALLRELKEELNLSLEDELKNDNLVSIDLLGLAVTPDFNPIRFSTYFFKITLKEKIPFIVDENEAESSFWIKSSHLLEQFNKGEVLAVPPTIKVIKSLGENIHTNQIKDLNFEMPKDLVPWIESMAGVVQVMPLSNTLPPATKIGRAHV